MHGELVVNQSSLGVVQTAILVMQISPAALPAETGVVPVGLAVMQTATALYPQSLGKVPPGIAVLHGGSGRTSDGITMVHYQPAEIPLRVAVCRRF